MARSAALAASKTGHLYSRPSPTGSGGRHARKPGPGLPEFFLAAIANASSDRPPLEDDRSCDVCVMGAGDTGLSAALHLAGRFDVLAGTPKRKFPGGAMLRSPTLAFGFFYYRLRDWLRDF